MSYSARWSGGILEDDPNSNVTVHCPAFTSVGSERRLDPGMQHLVGCSCNTLAPLLLPQQQVHLALAGVGAGSGPGRRCRAGAGDGSLDSDSCSCQSVPPQSR